MYKQQTWTTSLLFSCNFSAYMNLKVLHHGHKGMAPTQDQIARGDSSSSDYFSCISSENTFAGAGKESVLNKLGSRLRPEINWVILPIS